MEAVGVVVLLVVVATVVAVAARRISVPAPSLLVVVGLLVGLIPAASAVHVPPESVSLVVLPMLVYAAGEELAWRDLRQVWRPVAGLALGLVLVSAVTVALVAWAVTPLPWSAAFILGAVLCSTDPVAVSALARRLSLPSRVQTLVLAESLFNDATSLILFRLAVTAAVVGGTISPGTTVTQFVLLAGGGVAIGAAVGGLVALLRRYTVDPVVESVISLATPYAAYLLAELAHASGVTAVVVASVVLGTVGPRLATPATRLQLHAVHATAVFILESVVFGLIGLQLPALVREERHSWVLPAVLVTAALLLVRVAWVYPMTWLRRRGATAGGRVGWQVPAVVSWAGARGVVPLAAALSIPLVDATGAALPYRSLILILAIAVIVVSLVVQGFTLEPLVRRAGVTVPHRERQDEYRQAWLRLTDAAMSYLDSMEEAGGASAWTLEQARRAVQAANTLAVAEAGTEGHSYRELRRDLLATQEAELWRMYRDGAVSETNRRALQRQLDLQTQRLDGA